MDAAGFDLRNDAAWAVLEKAGSATLATAAPKQVANPFLKSARLSSPEVAFGSWSAMRPPWSIGCDIA
jgi:hypothetical protein